MKKIVYVVLGLSALIPSQAFAASGDLDELKEFVVNVGELIQILIPLFFALILVAFFWGLVTYLFALATGADGAQERGKGIMIGGVLALFVGASVFYLVVFIQSSLGLDGEVEINIPFVDVERRTGGNDGSTSE